MKPSFFARVYSAHPLTVPLGLCAIALTVAGVRWMWLAPGASERAATAAARELSTNLGGQVVPVLQSLAGTVNGIPAMAHELAETAVREVSGKAQAEIRHGVDLIAGPAGQVAGARADVVAIAGKLDARIGVGIQVADQRLGEVAATAAGIRKDAQPALVNAAELMKDGKDSWDDLYDDVRGAVASGVVAITSVAQTSEAIRAEAPKFTAAATKAVESGASLVGIANEWADKNVRPRPTTLKEKFLAVVKVGIAIFIAALRGGAL